MKRNKIIFCYAILAAVVFLQSVSQAGQPAPIIGLGMFSNYQYTEEHQYGSAVELWREGNTLFGLFSNSEGLMGDTTTGLLEKIKYDPTTGHISFTARLTMGIHSCKVHKNIPSQDIYSFDGVLSKASLTGTLMYYVNLHQDQPPNKEKVVLKKADGWEITQYSSREKWDVEIKNIPKFRGPKW